MLVSGVQKSKSVKHIQEFIIFQILLPFRMSQNIEQHPLCYTQSPCWLSTLNIAVCQSQILKISRPPCFPPGNHTK